jgi:hypothetical protein
MVTVSRPVKIQGKSVIRSQNRVFPGNDAYRRRQGYLRETTLDRRRALDVTLLDRCVNGDMRKHAMTCFSQEMMHLIVGAHFHATRRFANP